MTRRLSTLTGRIVIDAEGEDGILADCDLDQVDAYQHNVPTT